MKREGNLLSRIAERGNLRLALALALRGQRGRRGLYWSGDELEAWLTRLGREILEGTVSVGTYRRFVIHDPKRRIIHAPAFRERVLHHAILNVAGPRLERLAIADSFASRVGKGVHLARERARQFCRRFAWFLKLDVRSYFDSIDHDRLLAMLARLFKDRALLLLLARIVRCYQSQPGRGMPIGSLISQHAANAYLSPLDRLIKEGLRAPGYVRYMDDMVIWHDSPRVLAAWEQQVEDLAQRGLGLVIKRPRLCGRCHDGLPFLGARVLPSAIMPNRTSRRRLLRKLSALEAAHAVGRIGSVELQSRGSALVAALAHTRSLSWRRDELSLRAEAR